MSDQKMSPEAQEVLERLIGQGGPQAQATPGFEAQQSSPLEMISEQMQQMGGFLNMLREGMQTMSYGQSQMGIMLDTCRLYIQMISRVVIEAGMITQEDFEAKYKIEVADRLKTLMEEAEAQAEAELKEAGVTCEPCGEKSCEDCEDANCSGDCPIDCSDTLDPTIGASIDEQDMEPDLDELRDRKAAGELLLASERDLLSKEDAALQEEEELEDEDGQKD